MKTKENSINLLLFLDVGGSMDIHVKQVESLFSAAKHTFKNLEYFYFHNCMYEHVWKENSRRWNKKYSSQDILNTYQILNKHEILNTHELLNKSEILNKHKILRKTQIF